MRKIFFILLLCFSVSAIGTESLFLAQVDIENGISNEKITFFYDELSNKVLEINQNSLGNNTEKQSYTEYLYAGNLFISQIKRKWNGNDFENEQKIDFEFQNQNCIKKTIKIWENNQWKNAYIETYSYNIDNNITSFVSQQWINNQWVNSFKTENTYNSKKELTESVFYLFDLQWNASRKINYTYHENGLLSEELLMIKPSSEWQNETLIKSYYNQQNLLELQENQEWDNAHFVWKKQTRFEFSYNEHHQLISETHSCWSDSFWENKFKVDYSFLDTNENIILSKKYYAWEYKMFLPVYEEERTYNADFSIQSISSSVLFWESNLNDTSYSKHFAVSASDTYFGHQIDFTYKTLSEVIKETEPETKMSSEMIVYPNPSSDGFYYVDTQKFRLNQWTLCSFDGKILKHQDNQKSGITSGVININEYANGIYMLRLNTHKGLFIIKIIKM